MRLANDHDLSDGVKFMGSLYEHWERDYYIELKDVQAGKYMAFVELDWHESLTEDQWTFNITNYGKGYTHFTDETGSFEKEEFLK